MYQPSPFVKKKRISDEMTIQITSMADVFIIILVFLLKSFSSSAVDFKPPGFLKLPVANAPDDQGDAIAVEISSNLIQIDGRPAILLNNFRVEQKDILANGSSANLDTILKFKKERQLLISKSNTDVHSDTKILIIADQKTPYATLKTVLASAAINGYTDFKLVVAKREQ